ncbi:hypothetical protein [Pseudomonas sp. JUb52]|uniref:hypothetical protein n=1 Tax=Pseudomonas sp. JUb52 TaxID=2485127 RepID=UPI001048212A|nr:hypothetical protein [Pseudomonas sp. JUb52]TCQ84241.1 hypothetical protein EC839_113115 [Pseudomonas sp. JUb52]
MHNQEAYIAKAQSMIYEGDIKLSAQDVSNLLLAIDGVRQLRPYLFDQYTDVCLKVRAMEAELQEELGSWQVKQELEEQRRQEVEKRKAVELLLAQARLERAQKRLAEAQENAA